MAKRRRMSLPLVVGGLILMALLLAFPAAGDPEPCPKDWTMTIDYSDRDRNSNTMMCSKTVNGEGNNGQGRNMKEDREPRLR
jgi:hypothetical protein